ncbi:MAG: DUF4175 domain-containing protein [Saprospirales bacterium]|nr:DUF4175 domain-containing protein [Saprospirales bacterium]
MENYQLLIGKLDEFIRKYYLNQLIRGSLYSIALILVLFLGLNFLEYYFYFDATVRKVLFFSFLGISLGSLAYWVVIPGIHYFQLGKLISHEQAAQIIGSHFSDVRDRLLNVLQLKGQADSAQQKELILASINQKSESIKLVPFQNAIDLGTNRKYLKYALPPLLLLILVMVMAPSLIPSSTNRLLRNNEEFERPAPFRFLLEEEALSVVQFDDYPLQVRIEGDQIPDQVFIEVDNYQYRMVKESPDVFTYQFSNVQKDMQFHLHSGRVESKPYTLEVLKKPSIAKFDVELDFPAYTKRKDEIRSNMGDMVVPVGTQVKWFFQVENTDALNARFSSDQKMIPLKRASEKSFSLQRSAMRDELYKLFISNQYLPNADSVGYSISVIPDEYPAISVEKFEDSTQTKLFYFVGEASDDYGLLNLSFNYRISRFKAEQEQLQSVKLRQPEGKATQYSYSWDLNNIDLRPGDQITYFFEVFDNDGVNGSKSSRTNLMVFAMPTVEEFEQMSAENNEEIKDRLQEALKESKKIQAEMKELREKLLQQKDLDWQKRKELERLLNRQKELQKEIEQAKQAFEENMKNQEEISKTDENIQEKQEQLQKLFEEALSEEMQELMEKIEELMKELEKEGALDMMEEFQFNDEELEKELDRMLELFKQLELEAEMEKMVDKLEELAAEQEELSEDTKEEKEEQENLEERQEDINESFEKVEEKMEELEKKNKELERPKELGDHEEQMKDIEEDLKDSKENLEKKENQKASQKQKKAAEKMREMAQSMSMQMEGQAMEQMEEDMEALRQLLENLVTLSFDQEDLIDEFGRVNINTPQYVDLVQQQFKLKDDFRLIEDSLQALSKRVFQIESFVTEKVMEIKTNMKQGLEELEERRKPQAGDHQQRVMKNANDLALMLSEVMNQMQQQMSGMMSGNQMCNKPGGSGGQNGKVPQDKISEGQKKLNEEMQKAKEGMKKGGDQPGSKEFAQMAARQGALRQALREKQKALQQQGKGSKELQEVIDQMNKMEIDLVNKRLTNEMQKRQEEILTRLLEHEKAEREREQDNQRKSEQAKNYERPLPPSLEEYLKKREAEIELYRTVSPSLKPYYKMLVEEYYKSLK